MPCAERLPRGGGQARDEPLAGQGDRLSDEVGGHVARGHAELDVGDAQLEKKFPELGARTMFASCEKR